VDAVIGVGGMGRVVRAAHLYLQQPVAIKILLRELAESQATVARFLREAQATVQLKSEHIARVTDVGTLADGTPVMVMEYLTGNDLNQILRHHGPQAPGIVCDLILQACEGLAEAHAAGIVHRDVKPSNFFITQRPDGSMLLKILDFGISKTPVGLSDLTGTQTVLGTPTYMAPEQMKSGRTADARSDIWSLGVVMYQLLTGRTPFAAESYAGLVLQVNSEPPAPMQVPLPAGLTDVILRCLEKDPRARFQSVAELARVIAPFATDPLAGSASASRAARTLQHRSAGPLQLPAPGGLAIPMPLSPAQLTPTTGAPSSSSLSHGVGQMTLAPRVPRAWAIAGVAALVLVAGLFGASIGSSPSGDAGAGSGSSPRALSAPQPTDEPAPAAPARATDPVPAAVRAPDPEPAPAAAPAPEPAPAAPAAAELPVAAIPQPPPASPTFPAGSGVGSAQAPAAAPARTAAAPAPSTDRPRPTAGRPRATAERSRPKPTEKARPSTKPRPRRDDLFDTRH
jgi:serine/threonine-protein kinase